MAKTKISLYEEMITESPTLSNSNEFVNVSPPQNMPKLSPKVFNKDDTTRAPHDVSHQAMDCTPITSFEGSFSDFIKQNMKTEFYDSHDSCTTFTKFKKTEHKFSENNNIKFCKENIPFRDIMKDTPQIRNKLIGMNQQKTAVISRNDFINTSKKVRKSVTVENKEVNSKKHHRKELGSTSHPCEQYVKEEEVVRTDIKNKHSSLERRKIRGRPLGSSKLYIKEEKIDEHDEMDIKNEEPVLDKRKNRGRPLGSLKSDRVQRPTKTRKSKRKRKEQIAESPGDLEDNDKDGDLRYCFSVGQDVLARWSDGLFYLGTVLKIKKSKAKCYVRFEDLSEYWILFKDLQKGAKDDEISCCVCQTDKSEKPNEIVLCDNCGLGYHQECHYPNIGDDVLAPDVEWCCRLCIFAAAVKEGGALKNGPDAKALQQMKQSFPYKLESLTWDVQHKVNVEQCYCYCGGPGDWYLKMLQCCRCKQWFHEACIQCLEYPLMNGDKFYLFVCSHCNTGPEYIKRLEMTWSDLTHLALFNLTIQIKSKGKYFDADVISEVVDANWEKLQLTQFSEVPAFERKKYIMNALASDKKRFGCGNENRKSASLFFLRLRAPPSVPTLILPLEGQVTDEIMKNLQLTGTKKVKQFVPIICKSPVPLNYRGNFMEMKDSIALKSRKNLKLAVTKDVVEEPYSANQNYKGYTGKCYSVKEKTNTLSSLIPTPLNFEGFNHPFKTECEQNEEKAFCKRKDEVMKYLFLTTEDYHSLEDTEDNGLDESSVVSMKGSRKRKFVDEKPVILTSKRRRIAVSDGLATGYTDVSVTKSVDDSAQSNSDRLWGSDKIRKGEGYSVYGRRTSKSNVVQYLVKFDGLATK